ncbi:Avt4 protein [Martiniozyma asiatica (nom. inval.)]|nr:Avt4 protein [Martiniozyma asiatica]
MSYPSSRRTSMARLSDTPSRRFFLTGRAPSPALVSDDELATTPKSTKSIYDDPNILKSVSRHLVSDVENSLKLSSGDITRDVYKSAAAISDPVLISGGAGGNGNSNSSEANSNSLRRSKSLTGSDLFTVGERRESMASQLREPGAFRREFLQRKKYGFVLERPTMFTRNFLEFLSIYGHFAGEDLEGEDFLACDYDTRREKDDEESPLLRNVNINGIEIEIESEAGGEDDETHKVQAKTSSIKAFFLLIKAFIGTGVLFLPKAFSNGGLVFSIGLLLFFSIISFYCYWILAQCTIKTKVSSFVELGDKTYGPIMKYLILFSIVLSQLGFVAAYAIFTAENLKAFIFNCLGYKLELWWVVIFEAFFFVPMSLIRNITKLSLAALMANVFILSGIITIVIYTSKDLIKTGVKEVQFFNASSWSLFIGVAIFAFEGIGLIIPVQQSMKYPQQFPLVLTAVITTCCFLFIGVGTLGYLTYGDSVQTVVILNLPQNAIPVICIQFFYALAIMLSVPLQLLPAIRIIETRIFGKRASGRVNSKTKWLKNIFRTFITIGTCVLAWAGSDDLDLFVSIVGCTACVPLVYMYPAMLHAKIYGGLAIFDWSLVIFGGVATVYTTYQLFT